jgi:ABC-2 type transport system ATP-binding protein
LLDEPTDGLDPEGIKWFRDFVLRLRDERGMTVLFNSHLLAEVELMCDRVTILREGRRVFEGAVGGLHEDDLMFETDLEPWENAIPLIHAMGGEIPMPGRIRLPHGADPALLVESLVGNGVRLRALAPVRRSLEDLYMEMLNGAGSPN